MSRRPKRRDRRWFMKGVIPDAPITVLYGEPASLKSFLMLDWMLHADRGLDWYGHGVAPGRCLYIPGEGADGMHDRIDAWCEHNEQPRENLYSAIAEPVNLYRPDREAVDQLIEQVRHDGPVRYVVFDTMHSLSGGMDENDAGDMGRVLQQVKDIVYALGYGHDHPPRAFIVHHTGKDGRAIRGSSALFGATDNQFKLKRTGKGRHVLLSADKVKDAKEPDNITVHFDIVPTGELENSGEPVTSLVSTHAVTTGASGAEVFAVMQSNGKREEVREFKRDHPDATNADIARALQTSESTVSRALKDYSFAAI